MNAEIKFYTRNLPAGCVAIAAIQLPYYSLRFDLLIKHEDRRGYFTEWPKRHWDRQRTAVQVDNFAEWNTWVLDEFDRSLQSPIAKRGTEYAEA